MGLPTLRLANRTLAVVGGLRTDPMRENRILEAEVIDAKRLIHVYEFTSIADLSWYEKLTRYRHPKFTDNMIAGGEYATHREFTARHAVRQLGLGEDAFPVTVSLYARITDTPPAGTPVADPMIPPRVHMIDRYQFASLEEVRP